MLHTEKRSLIPWTLKVCAAVLSLFGMSVIPMGAQSVLSGTVVTASDGQPIVGAYVLVKGTTVGTTTEVDGTFRIEASSGTILEVSQMGYVTRQVKASDGIRIALMKTSFGWMTLLSSAMAYRKRSLSQAPPCR